MRSLRMSQAVLSVLLLLELGCGRGKEEQAPAQPPATTPYGTVEDVSRYLDQIDPYIHKVSALQARVDQQVGTSGKATGRNLARAMREVRPELQQAMDEFSKIRPPGPLAAFHARIARLMATRMEAYSLTISSQESPVAGGEPVWHAQVEAKLEEANALITELNGEMQRINTALEASLGAPTRVASP